MSLSLCSPRTITARPRSQTAATAARRAPFCPGCYRRLSAAMRRARPARHAAHQPTLHERPRGARLQEHGDRAGHRRNGRVDADADRDLGGSERERLCQNAAGVRVDELGKQRQIQHCDFRVQQIGKQPHSEQFSRPIDRQMLDFERRTSAGAQGLPREPQQVGGARKPQGVIGVRHGEDERSDAERSAQTCRTRSQRQRRRGISGRPCALVRSIARSDDHVWAGRQHHPERDQGEGDKVDERRHGDLLRRYWRMRAKSRRRGG